MLERLRNFVADRLATNVLDVVANGSKLQTWALSHSLEAIMQDAKENPANALFDMVSIAPLAPRDSTLRDSIIENTILLADIVADSDIRKAIIAMEFIPFSPPSNLRLKDRVTNKLVEFGDRFEKMKIDTASNDASSCAIGARS